jgi:Na+-translocating ferredoxin:NAD+ oxidoreductase RnfD subunit
MTGRSFIAIWHSGPIGGFAYWRDICLSPELLIFVFFMMSDPKTTPRTQLGRVIYGAATAVVAAALLFWEPTEFGIKVAILASLTVVCALVPAIDAVVRRRQASLDGTGEPVASRRPWRSVLGSRSWRSPALVAAVLIAIAAPTDTIALRSNKQIGLIEQGLTGSKNPQ